MEGWKLKGTCTGDTCIHRKTEKYWFYINGEQKIEKNGRRNLRFYSWWEYNFLQTSGCNMFPKNFCTVQRGNRGSSLFLHPQWICSFPFLHDHEQHKFFSKREFIQSLLINAAEVAIHNFWGRDWAKISVTSEFFLPCYCSVTICCQELHQTVFVGLDTYFSGDL